MNRSADTGLAVAASVTIAWLWGMIAPDAPMPQEVAASIGAIVGPFIEDIRSARRLFARRFLGGDDGKA